MGFKLVEKRGFTLIELMIVMAIISLLASMAIPQYYNFTCKARQSEAKESLGMLAKCQEAYFCEYDTYSTDKNRIGFFMRGNSIYNYEIVSADNDAFDGEATAIFRGITDKWAINQTLNLRSINNACIY